MESLFRIMRELKEQGVALVYISHKTVSYTHLVGHHGSSTSTSYIFLNTVLPEMGIISCGVNNKYGHPHEETLSILRDAGVRCV